jgi:hypothetical protein
LLGHNLPIIYRLHGTAGDVSVSKSQLRRLKSQHGVVGKLLSQRIKDDDFWHVEEVEALERNQSQEANARLCACAFEEEMMGKVPEGSYCPFCGRRRYESVILVQRELKKLKKELCDYCSELIGA